jgi:NAD-dependent SIR2 family protein deacetylase
MLRTTPGLGKEPFGFLSQQGHITISKLHEKGFLTAVITQNIDGLHQASGIPDDKIIELYGNTRRVRFIRNAVAADITNQTPYPLSRPCRWERTQGLSPYLQKVMYL